MGGLPLMEIKADGAGFRAFGADAVPDGFLGVFRHQLFQLGFGGVVIEIGRAGPAKYPGKFRPGIGGTHIDDPHRLDPRTRRLDAEQGRGLATLDAVPELLLGGE